MVGWLVTAFQPSCQIPREPSIEKNCVERVVGACGASKLERMLTPSKRAWVWPLIACGGSTPRTSKMVGTRSIAWWYWLRISPRAWMPWGQEMMQGSEVPPLNSYRFHILNGVLNAIAHPLG